MRCSVLILGALLYILTGCAQHPVIKSEAGGKSAGIAYYLPKRLVKVELERSPVPDSKDVAKAKADVTSAKAEADKAQADVKVEEAVLKKLGAESQTSPEYAAQLAKLRLAQAKLKLAQDAQAKAAKTLGEAEAAFILGKAGHVLVDKLTVTLLGPVPDTSQRFVAVPQHVSTRSDQLALKTTSAGLLTNSDATVEDQTAAIIVAIAGAISGLKTAAPLPFVEQAPAKHAIACDVGGVKYPAPAAAAPFSIEYTFDPTDEREISSSDLPLAGWSAPRTRLEALLCSLGAHYRFQLMLTGPSPSGEQTVGGGNGLYYRRELPYVLSVYAAKGDALQGFTLAKSVGVALSNKSPIEMLPMESGEFVARTYSTVFENGMLVSHAETKPSEALAAAKIPIDVLKAIFSIPTELIQLKINYASKDKELADAQKNLIDALQALERAKQNAAAPAPTTP